MTMNISIDLPPELEQALRDRAAAAGQDVASFLKSFVAARLDEEAEPATRRRLSHVEYAERLRHWVKLHPSLEHAIDDSRESFYPDRGS